MGLLNPSSVCISLLFCCVIFFKHAHSTPIFGEPISSLALSGAAGNCLENVPTWTSMDKLPGLVLTGASGATLASIPAVTLLAGKALLIKKLLLKKGKKPLPAKLCEIWKKQSKLKPLICAQPYLVGTCTNNHWESSRGEGGHIMADIRGGQDRTIGEGDNAHNYEYTLICE